MFRSHSVVGTCIFSVCLIVLDGLDNDRERMVGSRVNPPTSISAATLCALRHTARNFLIARSKTAGACFTFAVELAAHWTFMEGVGHVKMTERTPSACKSFVLLVLSCKSSGMNVQCAAPIIKKEKKGAQS